MRNFMMALLSVGFFFTVPAYAETTVTRDYIQNTIPQAEPVGSGRMEVMFLDIYDATLYAPQGEWQADEPFALSLHYLRDIEGRKIADTSASEMRNLGMKDEIKLATWHGQMRDIFPDVDKGTILTGVYTVKGESVFFRQGQEIGRIKDPEFGRYFFQIWLSEQTKAPELRADLLGVR